jgi:hypothetical protein
MSTYLQELQHEYWGPLNTVSYLSPSDLVTQSQSLSQSTASEACTCWPRHMAGMQVFAYGLHDTPSGIRSISTLCQLRCCSGHHLPRPAHF